LILNILLIIAFILKYTIFKQEYKTTGRNNMTLKKILCIGALMALPMSMSAGSSEKLSIEKVFHNTVEALKNEQGTAKHACEYRYYLENDNLHNFTRNKPVEVVHVENLVNEKYGPQQIGTFALKNTLAGVLVTFEYFSTCDDDVVDKHHNTKDFYTHLMKEKGIDFNFNQAKKIKLNVVADTIIRIIDIKDK
jgi:hypothetical protein